MLLFVLQIRWRSDITFVISVLHHKIEIEMKSEIVWGNLKLSLDGRGCEIM